MTTQICHVFGLPYNKIIVIFSFDVYACVDVLRTNFDYC